MKITRRRMRTWALVLLVCILGAGVLYFSHYSQGSRLNRLRAELLREPPTGISRFLIKLGLMNPRTDRDSAEVCADLEAIGPPAARILMDAFKTDVPQVNYNCIASSFRKIGDIRFIEDLSDPDEMVADLHASSLLTQFADHYEGRLPPLMSFLPVYRRLMKHANPEVRAAAADAIGILHRPAFDIPIANAWHYQMSRGMTWGSSDPIDAVNRITGAMPFPIPAFSQSRPSSGMALPDEVRAEVLAMMVGGATSVEREAAARALLEWPPKGYQLRVAEWGVWIDSNGQLVLVQSQLDEIPDFVHRTGNPAAEFKDRVEAAMMVFKPIIHITADQPLSVDLEVIIDSGRPWFAYPMPDDFTLTTLGFGIGGGGRITPDETHPEIAQFDNPKLPPLKDIREGYPWAWPNHRKHIDPSGGRIGPVDIGSLGVRWQSLIVSPKVQPWMSLPTVPKDEKFRWWETLRDVPCSAVSSRGESEKFLYYDGPTRRTSPVRVELANGNLRCTQQEIRNDNDYRNDGQTPSNAPRSGLLIQVSGRDVVARRVTVPATDGIVVPKPAQAVGEEASAAVLANMLVEGGLTQPEAGGLVRCWRKQFFQTPGRRFLLQMTREDYDRACPLTVRPPPTQTARVGLVLTEL